MIARSPKVEKIQEKYILESLESLRKNVEHFGDIKNKTTRRRPWPAFGIDGEGVREGSPNRHPIRKTLVTLV